MQENILLVPYLDLERWPNDLHLQLNQTQDEQIIRGRSSFVCFVPEFSHQIQYIP